MRHIVFILLPLFMAAVPDSGIPLWERASARDARVTGIAPGRALPPAAHSAIRIPHSAFTIGLLDTIGGTTWDLQNSGPAQRALAYDPNNGIHARWMHSIQEGMPFSDRNSRYNFDNGSGWQFSIGPDFIEFGVQVFDRKAVYGNIDYDPATGVEYISAHMGPTDRQYPVIARDQVPGLGVFELDSGTTNLLNYFYPSLGVSASGRIHCAVVNNPDRDQLYYTGIGAWPDWSDPSEIPPPATPPSGSNHVLVASHHSNRVAVTWVDHGLSLPWQGFYRLSEDDGATWQAPVTMPMPPAFVGGDTVSPTFDYRSLNPFFDSQDNLHVVGSFCAVASESTFWELPVEVWHWSEATGWSKVVRCWASEVAGTIGLGQPGEFATHMTLAEGNPGELFCVWHQYDSLNVESETGILRSDIWAAASNTGGATWRPAVRLTDPDLTSKQFPSLAPELKGDTLLITWMADQVAGYCFMGQGSATHNPLIVQRVFKGEVTGGIAEQPALVPTRLALNAAPNPSRGVVSFACRLPGKGELTIRDIAGRRVRTLEARSSVVWNGRDAQGNPVTPGVYFCTLESKDRRVTERVTLVR